LGINRIKHLFKEILALTHSASTKLLKKFSAIIVELIWPIEKAIYPGFSKVADDKKQK
jgi:hypothetical protein